MEFIKWEDIKVKGSESGTKKTTCPNCSHNRKKKTDPCLYVNFNSGVAKCFHCGALSFRDDIKKETEVNYKLPPQTWKNHTKLSDNFVKWFQDRGISQDTLNELSITEEVYYQPSLDKKVNNIVFNYFEGETLVNKKYRSGNKRFTQTGGTKSIFYNINSIMNEKECYIVEGEIDVLSLHEIGIKNVISVPNGANNNDDYWINAEPYLKDIEKFYIATDMDDKGQKLSNEIAQRLGRWKCERIEFTGNDANDDLKNKTLKESLKNKKRYPVSGTFTVSDLYDDILDLHDNGMPTTIYPKKERWGNMKEAFSTMFGHVITTTGIPSHGKSAFVEDYVVDLIDDYDLKASFFSPEHSPMQLHQVGFIQRVIGKNFWKDLDNRGRITKEDIKDYKEWADEKIYLTGAEKDAPTWDWLFGKFKEQMYSFGINIFVVDAFNKVLLPKGNKIDAINEVLTKLTAFAQQNNVIVFLIAHPTKMTKKEDGSYNIPDLYNVSGSADFRNQTHDGFTVHRIFESQGQQGYTEIHVTKLKHNFQGKMLEVLELYYDVPSGRYYMMGTNKPTYNLLKPINNKVPQITTKDAFNDEDFTEEIPF